MVDSGSIASLGQAPIQSPTVDRDTQRSVVSPRSKGWDGGQQKEDYVLSPHTCSQHGSPYSNERGASPQTTPDDTQLPNL